MLLRLILKLWSSYLHLLCAGVTYMCHHVKRYFSQEVSQVPSLFFYGWMLRRYFPALRGFAGSRYGGSVLFLLTPHLQPQKKPSGLQTQESGLPAQPSSALTYQLPPAMSRSFVSLSQGRVLSHTHEINLIFFKKNIILFV